MTIESLGIMPDPADAKKIWPPKREARFSLLLSLGRFRREDQPPGRPVVGEALGVGAGDLDDDGAGRGGVVAGARADLHDGPGVILRDGDRGGGPGAAVVGE